MLLDLLRMAMALALFTGVAIADDSLEPWCAADGSVIAFDKDGPWLFDLKGQEQRWVKVAPQMAQLIATGERIYILGNMVFRQNCPDETPEVE